MSEDDALAALVGSLAPGSGAGWIAKRLPTVSAEASFTVHGAPHDAAIRLEAALRLLDASCARNPAPEHEVWLSGHVGSGRFNMNPTVFGAVLTTAPSGMDSIISIRAVAKEGLIKQGSAQKVIERVRSALQREATGGGSH
jgi:hypothetical protein